MEYIISVDLGQAGDYTAIAILTKLGADPVRLECQHLERLPLGTGYPQQVAHIAGLIQRIKTPDVANLSNEVLPGQRVTLVIDRTGVGRAIFDMFRDVGVRPVGITITGGLEVTRTRGGYNVPKYDLVGALIAAMGKKEIFYAKDLPFLDMLIRELQNFRVKVNLRTGHDSYEAWREGVHDDLVLAVALGVWYGNRRLKKVRGWRPGAGKHPGFLPK